MRRSFLLTMEVVFPDGRKRTADAIYKAAERLVKRLRPHQKEDRLWLRDYWCNNINEPVED